MDPITQQAILATAGAAGGDKVYVDDVFSTYLTVGAGGQTIPNGIDLATEGGMVWSKARGVATPPVIHDTERGVNKFLQTVATSAQIDLNGNANGGSITAWNNNGFTTGNDGSYGFTDLNGYGNYVHWTFRKAPGFFDVVTYTGNGSSTGDSQTISHDLGSTPGFVMIKRTSDVGDWVCWHRSISTGQPRKYIELNPPNAPGSMGVDIWGTVNSTGLEVKHNGTVGDSYEINKNGETYVAYFFAHDDQSFGTGGNESIIKCGTFNIPGTGTFDVNLGFEPQFIFYKQTSGGMGTPDWHMHDTMRGLAQATFNPLYANTTTAESPATTEGLLTVNPLGFKSTASAHNAGDYIYMAIRRPHKPPTVGTEVFSPTTYTGNATARLVGATTNLCDLAIISDLDANTTGWATYGQYVLTRLTGNGYALASATSGAEGGGWGTYFGFDENKGLSLGGNPGYMNNNGTDFVLYNFKRAPGFLDVVAYSGTGSAQSINHNLGVAPEILICKKRSSGTARSWIVGVGAKYLELNEPGVGGAFSFMFPSSPTSTSFSISSTSFVNENNADFIAYLFATLPGISKVGTYNGVDNTTVTEDCGFTGGPRFLLIKRLDATGGWQVWNSARGINSGTNSYDPYIFLNSTAAESIYGDYIDPTTSGFTIKPAATAAGLNTTGGTYLYLAIA